MAGWLGVAEGLGILVVLIALVLVLLAARRRWLDRQGGTFECSMRRRTSTPGTGWMLGVARYNGGYLEWFRFFSFAARPRQTFPRAQVHVLDSRRPDAIEAVALSADQRIVRLEVIGFERELAMTEDSVTGLLSWLEAAPPGRVPR